MGTIIKLPRSRGSATRTYWGRTTVYRLPRWHHRSTILVRNYGIVIRKHGAVFNEGQSADSFTADVSWLDETDWCWHWTRCDGRRAITWNLMPRMQKYFEKRQYHIFNRTWLLPLPDWIDAEYLDEGRIVALYGDKGVT